MKASAFNINNDETAHYIIIVVNGVINRTRQYWIPTADKIKSTFYFKLSVAS